MFANQETLANVALRAQFVCLQLRQAMENMANFASWLAAQTNTDLSSLGFTTQDITFLRSAFHDFTSLNAINHGQADPNNIPLPYDFTVNVKELISVA